MNKFFNKNIFIRCFDVWRLSFKYMADAPILFFAMLAFDVVAEKVEHRIEPNIHPEDINIASNFKHHDFIYNNIFEIIHVMPKAILGFCVIRVLLFKISSNKPLRHGFFALWRYIGISVIFNYVFLVIFIGLLFLAAMVIGLYAHLMFFNFSGLLKLNFGKFLLFLSIGCEIFFLCRINTLFPRVAMGEKVNFISAWRDSRGLFGAIFFANLLVLMPNIAFYLCLSFLHENLLRIAHNFNVDEIFQIIWAFFYYSIFLISTVEILTYSTLFYVENVLDSEICN